MTLDSNKFAQIKRLGGDAAAIRMLVAAKQKGAEPKAIVAVGKEIELSQTSLAKLRALVGVSVTEAAKPKVERRKKARALDRYRERRALERVITGKGFVAHPVSDDHSEAVLRLFGAYFDESFDVDTDECSLFIVRESDEDRLSLYTVERHRELASRVSNGLLPAEIPTRVDAETFADVFPNAAPVDEIEADGFVRLIVRSAKGF